MSTNKFKILVVEDESNISSFIETLLETSGYHALVAHTCAMGLTLFASHTPDLVILDLGLPDRDGQEMIRQVRKKTLTPIIVLSARTTEQDKIQALDLGANDYITKPFGTGELMARVRAALRSGHRGWGTAPGTGDQPRAAQGICGRAGDQTDPDRVQHCFLFVRTCRPGDDLCRHCSGYLGRYGLRQHQKAAGQYGQYP